MWQRLDSTTVVRLTPDQKVGSSNLSRVILYLYPYSASLFLKLEDKTTAAGFEPARAEPIGFQVQHLNHSVTLSYAQTHGAISENLSNASLRNGIKRSRQDSNLQSSVPKTDALSIRPRDH